ncbi:MAG: rod shape-determining protein MreC [Planctomycetota bacterium]
MRRDYVRSHILFPGLVLLALLLFLVPETHVESLRARSLSVLSPVLRLFGAAGRSRQPERAPAAVQCAAANPSRPEAPPENHIAEDFLRAEIVRLLDENARLRRSQTAPTPLTQPEKDGRRLPSALPAGLGADVIGRKVLWQEPILALDRGAADGVKLHAAVLHRGAVAGRVISVAPHVSCMALLTHRGMSVAARLVESRVEGVLQGAQAGAPPVAGEEGERLCRMAVVARELYVKTGEAVVTSGYDGCFPPGLWLGVVAGVKKKGDVQWELAVRPACTENAVECVQIITAELPEVPWPEMPGSRKGGK